MTPGASQAAGHTPLPFPQLLAGGSQASLRASPFYAGRSPRESQTGRGDGGRARGGFSVSTAPWPASAPRCSSPCFAAGGGEVCGFCLHLQVHGPSSGPAASSPSFKMKTLAAKSNFSGSDARQLPRSEAALRSGVRTAPPDPSWARASSFAHPIKQSGDPEPSQRGRASPGSLPAHPWRR